MGGRIARRSVSAAIVGAAIVALAAPGSARAQAKDAGGEIEMEPAASAPAKDPKAAHPWLVAGQRAMKKAGTLAARKRPDDARAQLDSAAAAFRKALEASDDPETRFELALADDKLGKLDDAVKQLRVIVATPALRPELARKAAAKLTELSAKVGVVMLTVVPDGTSITLGGIELGTSPLRTPLVLMPGTYTLSFLAEGFQPKDAEIAVAPGSDTTHAVALEAVPVVVEPPPPPPAPPVVAIPAAPAPPSPSKAPLVLGGAITVAAIAGAAVSGVLAVHQHDTFVGATTSALDRQDARDQGQRLARVSDLAIGTAVVAAGFTACWYLFKYRQHPEQNRRAPPVEAKLDVVPWVQSRSGGATLAGWF